MSESDPKNSNPCSKGSSDNHQQQSSSKYCSGLKQKIHNYNPPDSVNPDASTLRDQWKYATRQYAKWYSHAWGTAILAGLSFFALGWVIKGQNPLLSSDHKSKKPS